MPTAQVKTTASPSIHACLPDDLLARQYHGYVPKATTGKTIIADLILRYLTPRVSCNTRLY